MGLLEKRRKFQF